ncbi:trehalose operon repressor [Vibrio albus]|jgi:LacI family trehalose operon transcriptional repressor|uniref:Trehalose operon repressor n=1 Tax=Vibrio albus TaxID=2200953 RepID=A0A2U3BC51_9VIBR|nr:trehalose operon repressor TreR [Vibrio albus]PWI34372.1 trehalose operon repressor [Vibrio albus]
MGKKLTILDIAKLAGVGKSTVSRVLTDDPKVKPETRARVEQVIAESGYIPSKSAQSMRGGRQKVIGVIISRLDSPSENRAVRAILPTLYAAGYDVVIMESQFDVEKTSGHLDVLKRRSVDGVILFGFTGLESCSVERWKERIIVIAMEAEAVSSINYDNRGVIVRALEHVFADNKREIAYIGVDPEDKTTGELRLNAYLQWCNDKAIQPVYQTGQLHHESAYMLVDKVLKPETQAIVCASDTIALGVIKRLQELGRSDVSVTGVGGNDLLSFLFPNTYSVDPGYKTAGKTAAKQLIKQLSGETERVHLTLDPESRN